MLLEAALSFLGAGVQPPNSSWGTMISAGVELISSAPLLTIVPGTMILLTVLSLNVFGDGLRDALDPKSKVRLEAHAGNGRAGGEGDLMGRFVVRRLIGMVFVLFAISVIVFLIFNVIPNSDPAQRMAGKNADARAGRTINEEWGFDDPLPSST